MEGVSFLQESLKKAEPEAEEEVGTQMGKPIKVGCLASPGGVDQNELIQSWGFVLAEDFKNGVLNFGHW